MKRLIMGDSLEHESGHLSAVLEEKKKKKKKKKLQNCDNNNNSNNNNNNNNMVAVEFSEDEQMLVARMFNLVGKRWGLIAGRIPGRTAEEVEKYWTSRSNGRS